MEILKLMLLMMKISMILATGGSHLQSYLLRRQRLGGSWFEVSLRKQFVRPHLKNTNKKGW
jgi:hypothetical protein